VLIEKKNRDQREENQRRGLRSELVHESRAILAPKSESKGVDMQKFRCVVLMAFFFAIPLAAQTVRGRVTLQGENTPLPGVTVSIDELGLTTVTDADGKYSLTLPSNRRGEAKVTASLQGFTTRSATIDTSGNAAQDFVLRPSFGQEITVGSRAI